MTQEILEQSARNRIGARNLENRVKFLAHERPAGGRNMNLWQKKQSVHRTLRELSQIMSTTSQFQTTTEHNRSHSRSLYQTQNSRQNSRLTQNTGSVPEEFGTLTHLEMPRCMAQQTSPAPIPEQPTPNNDLSSIITE